MHNQELTNMTIKLPRPNTRVRALFDELYRRSAYDGACTVKQAKAAYDDHPPAYPSEAKYNMTPRRNSEISVYRCLNKFGVKIRPATFIIADTYRDLVDDVSGAKFKKGDLVRFVDGSYMMPLFNTVTRKNLVAGDVLVVKKVITDGYTFFVYFEEPIGGGWDEKRFELVTPITTGSNKSTMKIYEDLVATLKSNRELMAQLEQEKKNAMNEKKNAVNQVLLNEAAYKGFVSLCDMLFVRPVYEIIKWDDIARKIGAVQARLTNMTERVKDKNDELTRSCSRIGDLERILVDLRNKIQFELSKMGNVK